jgi:ParE toxin of type II toxin-antitoxin system, parDE
MSDCSGHPGDRHISSVGGPGIPPGSLLVCAAEQQSALRFIQTIDTSLQQIASDPERWPLYDDQHRWVKTRKYPYLLIYPTTGQGSLTVVAVAHTKRRAGYWRRRGSS